MSLPIKIQAINNGYHFTLAPFMVNVVQLQKHKENFACGRIFCCVKEIIQWLFRQIYIFYLTWMEGLRRQNEQIQKMIESYLEEIQKQKDLNAQHETQIQTLLKFNERLLAIIQSELSNNRKERDSLQPISQRSQRESDMVIGPIQSFIKARKFGPKSERGANTTNSLLEKASHPMQKLEFYGRDMKSQLNHSFNDEQSEYRSSAHNPAVAPVSKVEQSNQVKDEMLREIRELKEFKNKSTSFYDNKISEIKQLSTRINQYRPIDHFKHINSKLNISPNTANLLQKIINKT